MVNLSILTTPAELENYIGTPDEIMEKFDLNFRDAINTIDYAQARKNVLEHRETGNAMGVLINEEVCNRIYREMSNCIRW